MSKTKSTPAIIPTVTFDGNDKENAFKALFESTDAPLVKSIGCVQVPGANTYISFVMTTKGNEIISVEVDEPNLRAIAEESSKINFVNIFMGFGHNE